jgi:thiol:disulfide interchange protein DsbD
MITSPETMRPAGPRRMAHALSFCSLFFVLCNFSAASENPLKIELVSLVTSVQPGTPFHVGLHLQHPRGYHTYWKFPGIVGVPTGIAWKLPEGWKASPIEWPSPERVFMFQIKAQGFHGEKILPVLLTPPKNLKDGTTVTLQGKATWMCCGRDCNPGFQDLSLNLPIKDEAPTVDKRWTHLFAEASANVSRPCDAWDVKASATKEQVTIKITPQTEDAKAQLRKIKEVTFFTDDGLIDPNKPDSLTVNDDSIVLTQTISEYAPKTFPKRLQGHLQSPQGWLPGKKPLVFSVNVPLER